MTVIHESFIGTSGHPRYLTVIELERGMLMREERLAKRVMARELSFDFVREIAESTLPFQNVANLLENIVGLNEWTLENVSLKVVCQKIIKACNIAADQSKPPVTAYNVCGRMDFTEARKAGKACLGYDDVLHPGQNVVFVHADPDDWDSAGRGLKRYPHTYECILRPDMVAYYKKHDTYKEQRDWERRVDKDGSPRVMKRRVEEAEKRQAL